MINKLIQKLFTLSILIIATIYIFKKNNKQVPSTFQIQCKTKLQELSKICYDEEKHHSLLLILKEKFNISDWVKIGFQRHDDPTTDFRAFGILALYCMIESEAYKKLKYFQTFKSIELPYALTYINIGFKYLTKLNDDKFLAKHSFSTNDMIIKDFSRYIDTEIIEFEKIWLKSKPENIMSYNQVFNKYWKKYD